MNAITRTQLLVRARKIVGASLDLEQALTALAGFLTPTLADWCAIDVAEDDGTLNRMVVVHADPARLALAQTLRGRWPMSHEASHGPVKAIRTGHTLLEREADAGMIALTDDADHRTTLKALGVGSTICTALVGLQGPVGALTLVRAERSEAFTSEDATVARVLGASAGIAVVHGRLYREAQAASEAKDQFIATLGHELRNPIAAIMSAVSVLERLGTPDEPAEAARGIILRQVEHLRRLVDDLLDVARLTAGKITLQRRPVDLRDVVERCFATLRLDGRGDPHDLLLDAESATVSGDPTRLEQVVGNLLDNAVKYTPPGGRIAVTVRCDGTHALLHVQDNGIGIAADVLPHVFDLFTQAPQTLDRPRGGLGLGLALVRRLVDLHGGSVEAQSPGVGGGTTFTIRLPLTAAAEDTDVDVARGRPEVPPHRILIIEDHVDARDALRQLLEMDGHQVEVSGDGRVGIEAALRFRPDLVLIDIGLPGMSGYEVALKLRGEVGNDIRLVALTGYGQAGDRARAREAGFDSHLVKPVDPELLTRLLAATRARSRDAG